MAEKKETFVFIDENKIAKIAVKVSTKLKCTADNIIAMTTTSIANNVFRLAW